MSTLSDLDAIQKVFYVEDRLHKQFNQRSYLYDKLWKKWETDASGKSYTYAVHTSGLANAGSGYAEGGDFPAAATVGVANVVVPGTRLATTVELTGDIVRAARGPGRGAFVSSARLTVEQAMRSFIHSINRQLHSDGRDALAFWTAADNTSGTNVDDGQGNAFVHLPRAGTVTCDLIDATDNSTVLGNGIVVTRGANDDPNGVVAVTWTGSVAGSADADYLVLDGTLTNQLMGIRGIIDDANPPLLAGGLHGLTVAAAPYWVAQVFENPAGAGTLRDLTLELMQKPLTTIQVETEFGEEDVKFLLCNGPVFDKYISLCIAQKLQFNRMELDGGQSSVTFNNKPLVLDPQCRRNTIYYIVPDSMAVLTSSGGIIWAPVVGDGDQWVRKNAASGAGYADAYQAQLVMYGGTAAKVRNANAALLDLDEALG